MAIRKFIFLTFLEKYPAKSDIKDLIKLTFCGKAFLLSGHALLLWKKIYGPCKN